MSTVKHELQTVSSDMNTWTVLCRCGRLTGMTFRSDTSVQEFQEQVYAWMRNHIPAEEN